MSVQGLLGANPDCSCLCLLPQMANPVPSACCVVLAAVVVVYAQRHSQQGESPRTSPTLGVPKNVNAAPPASLLGQAGCPLRACLLLRFWMFIAFFLCVMHVSPPAHLCRIWASCVPTTPAGPFTLPTPLCVLGCPCGQGTASQPFTLPFLHAAPCNPPVRG